MDKKYKVNNMFNSSGVSLDKLLCSYLISYYLMGDFYD